MRSIGLVHRVRWCIGHGQLSNGFVEWLIVGQCLGIASALVDWSQWEHSLIRHCCKVRPYIGATMRSETI